MVKEFDRSKLGKDGYLVLVDDRDIQMPSKPPLSPLSRDATSDTSLYRR